MKTDDIIADMRLHRAARSASTYASDRVYALLDEIDTLRRTRDDLVETRDRLTGFIAAHVDHEIELAGKLKAAESVINDIAAYFDAADIDGLQDRINEVQFCQAGSWSDIVIRRLLPAGELARSHNASIAPEIAEPQPVAWGAAAVEKLAEWLCAEFDFSLNPCVGFSWPTHADDDGYRGDDAWVRLQPPDVQGHARDNARRIIRFLGRLEKPTNSPPDLTAENARVKTVAQEILNWADQANPAGYGGLPSPLYDRLSAALADQKGGAA